MAEQELEALLIELGVTMDVEEIGYRTERWPGSKDEWPHYAYTVTLTRASADYRFEVPYKMGTGLRGGPTLAGVFSSVLLDAESGEQDFEDFCADGGLDTDSRRAFAGWEACALTAEHVKRMFTDEERERLQLAAQDL